MVREKKTRIKDIEKLHELIDSASLPKQKKLSPYETERLESLRKRLSDDLYTDRRHASSSDVHPIRFKNLTPRVVIHKKGEMEKKDERVIQINLGSRDTKQEKKPEPSLVNFTHVKDDLFVSEPLYEIENIIVAEQKFFEGASVDHSETQQTPVEFIPVVPVQKRGTEHFFEPQPGKKKHIFHTNTDKEVGNPSEVFAQKIQPIEIEQPRRSSFSRESKENTPTFEPVEFTTAVPEKEELKPLIGEIQQATDDKQKKREKKQEKLERNPRINGKETKIHMEVSQTRHITLEEEKHKKQPKTTTVTEKEDQDVRLLVDEPNETLQQDAIDVVYKERKDRRTKKREERQARLALKEKKREVKRLSKEHDRKLKLEWIEFQHTQRQTQKTKALEEKKAAVKEKEKEQEEQRLLKEREEKVRLEQLTLRKKEKKEWRQKKREEKQVRNVAKEKEREVKRLTKEHERKLEFLRTEQLNQGTQKEKKLEPIPTTASSEVKQNLQKKKSIKRTPLVAPIHLEKKTTTEKTKISQIVAGNEEKSRKKKVANQKEESGITTWESFDEEVSGEANLPSTVVTKESPSGDTKKTLLALQKQEQKRLKQELKKQKMQKKAEEQKQRQLFDEARANRDQLKQKKIEEKLKRRTEKEKNRNEKKRLQEAQGKKEKAVALKELRIKEKEKEKHKQKLINEKKDRLHISKLSIGKAKDNGINDERKKVEQQKNTMELVRIAAEEKEHRKAKAFEKKMEKERKKKEREEQKFRMKEEANAKKKMDVHMKEAVLKEKLTNQPERNDPFVAFDSIDQNIALVLTNCGYSSIEKLRQASVKDLVKNGLKKKIAQKIIAECEEFVEWEVFDTTDY